MALTPKQQAMLDQLQSGVNDPIEAKRIELRFMRRMARKNRYAAERVASSKVTKMSRV